MEKEMIDHLKSEVTKSINESTKDFVKASEVESVKNEVSTVKNSVEEMTGKVDNFILEQKKAAEKNKNANKSLLDFIKDNSETLKAIKARTQRSAEFAIKATQVASDITSGSDYATLLDGTVRKPVRRVLLLDLFRSQNVSSEYIKYREEDVVTRDGKFVVACATSTHLTKKSWVVRTVELAKIRDIVDACIDMLDDYEWVEGEIRQLINESLMLKAEYELLLGASATATDMLSIDSISSEFNPANPLADFSTATGTPFADANIEQLVDAMSAQITIFGQENKWMADTVVMNYRDFVNYRNLKDANGNKLIKTLSDDIATIAGLRIITSPIVAQNELYVFDSQRGTILNRKGYTLNVSYENRDNIEHETVTFVAHARKQFHVPLIDRDAFMKCSNISTAITAITAP